jgi:hypothetical protein
MQHLVDTVIAYYYNEQSVLYSMICLSNIKEELISYNVSDSIEYLLETLNYKAIANDTLLTFCKEPGFPTELLGDKTKLELLFMQFLLYLVESIKKGEIKVMAKLRHIDDLGRFVLGFDLIATKTEDVDCDSIKRILHKKNEDGFCLCKTLMELLKATIEVVEKDEKNIKVAIEVPFKNADEMFYMRVPKLYFYNAVKVDKNTIKWVMKKPANNIQLDSAKTLNKYGNTLSPLLTSRGNEILHKRSVETNKQLEEQNRMRLEVMARLRASTGTKEQTDTKKAPISSFANGSSNVKKSSKEIKDCLLIAMNNGELLPYSQRKLINNLHPKDFKEHEEIKHSKSTIDHNQVIEYEEEKNIEIEAEDNICNNSEYLYSYLTC